VDISGGRSLRSYFGDIVALQGIPQSLPGACTARLDATSVWAAAPLLSSLLPLLSHKILSLQTEILIVKKIKKKLQILIEIWMIIYTTKTLFEAAE